MYLKTSSLFYPCSFITRKKQAKPNFYRAFALFNAYIFKRVILFLFLLTPFYLQSETLDLTQILAHVNKNHPGISINHQQVDLSHASAVLKQSTNPMKLNASGSMVSVDGGRSGQEYRFSLEKNILFGSSSSSLENYVSSEQDASKLREKQTVIELNNHISYIYHDVCLDQQRLTDYADVLAAFELLYEKREKAYRFGEISKKDLLLLSIELKLIRQKNRNLQSDYHQAIEFLRKEAYLLGNATLSCQDLKPIKAWDSVSLGSSLTLQALQSSLQASESLYQRFDKGISPVGVSMGIEQELDTKRISFGVSIPLNFSSNQQEAKRSLALSQKNILQSQYIQLKSSRQKEGEILRQKLDQSYNSIQTSRNILKLYNQELIPLLEKSFQLGESSLIELLLAKREMWRLKQDLSQQKKSYYASLFTFNNLVSSKE